jgi:hypothetical protein
MIPVSTLPTAVAALTAQIQAQVDTQEGANTGAVGVFTGDEDIERPPDRIIVMTGHTRTVFHEDFIGDLSQYALREVYNIDVTCSSYSGDPDGVANMNRAWVLAGYVETAVRTDPSLGTTVLIARPGASREGNSYWTANPIGRQTDVILTIYVETLN